MIFSLGVILGGLTVFLISSTIFRKEKKMLKGQIASVIKESYFYKRMFRDSMDRYNDYLNREESVVYYHQESNSLFTLSDVIEIGEL